MVSWIWIPVSIMVGGIVGVVVFGLVTANRDDEKHKWWEE